MPTISELERIERRRETRRKSYYKHRAKILASKTIKRRRDPEPNREASRRKLRNETPEERLKRLAYLAKYQAAHRSERSAKEKAKRALERSLKEPRKKLSIEEAKERQRESLRRFQERNREKLRLDTARRRAADPIKARAQWISSVNRRRARKNKTSVGDVGLIRKWEATWKSKHRASCYWCRQSFSSKDCHTDHIQPLSKGGAHAIENLCISCQPCNNRKSAKTLAAWNIGIAEPVLL